MACTSAGSGKDDPVPPPSPSPPVVTAPPAAPTPPAPAAADVVNVTVQMTAATLADECGGPPPASASASEPAPAPAEKQKSKAKRDNARRACDQSSMQLSVVAAAGSPVR